MPRRSLRAAAALAAASVSLMAATAAQAEVINDLDEPTITQDKDIAWARIDQPLTVHQPWFRVTVHTYGPFARTPCVRIATPAIYTMCDARVDLPGGGYTLVSVARTPAAAPDTVTYTFTHTQIGRPTWFSWRAYIPGGEKLRLGQVSLPPDVLPGPVLIEDRSG